MESVDFLASCTYIYSIGRARKKLLLSCSNPRPDSCLGKISRRACAFLDESLAWVLTEVALLRIYNRCMQQPAGFRHFTEACEVDSPVSRRFPPIHLTNRRTFTLFTSERVTPFSGQMEPLFTKWQWKKVLSTYRENGRVCKKEGREKEKKQKKRSGQCSAMPQFLLR